MKFIFASSSPRRKKLLSNFNLDIEFIPHRFNENSIDKNFEPYSSL